MTVGAQIMHANGEGIWGLGGIGTGCQNGITYPWSISAGPADGDRDQYEELLSSGDITEGTTTVWMDVAPDETVTVGWGVPEWAEVDAEATMCEPP